jgi:hypothetical protein
MLRDGKEIDNVASIFDMSRASVKLLQYGIIKPTESSMKCEICGKFFKQIMPKHLNGHDISMDEYKKKFPNAKTCTDNRTSIYRSFKNDNKGKTYEEIYGVQEGRNKKQKISNKQIGRKCALLAGTGISGTRKDTNTFARSTYEANIDRIFIYEGKRFIGEFGPENPRYTLINNNGVKSTYQPDRVDLDGLFEKNAPIEVKGYMYVEDWEKIKLFREQYKDRKLIIICPDKDYCDINYRELEEKYKSKIPLWETGEQNYKTRPDLYNIDYIEPERDKYLRSAYPNHISVNINSTHEKFIAKHCLDYIKVKMGKRKYNNTHIELVKLIRISNKRRIGGKKSSGKYNYELWEVETEQKEKFYVTNVIKTVLFYCYQEHKLKELLMFFENNNDPTLSFGAKEYILPPSIDKSLWDKSDGKQRDILRLVSYRLAKRSFKNMIVGLTLLETHKPQMPSVNDREKWGVFIDSSPNECKYIFTNFDCSTKEYLLKKA